MCPECDGFAVEEDNVYDDAGKVIGYAYACENDHGWEELH